MANRERSARRQPVGAAAAFIVHGRRDPVLDAARVLMLYGVVGVVFATMTTTTTGSRRPPGDADATRAFGGLVHWLLGVCLLALVPAAAGRRFQRAGALLAAAAAVANAVLGHLFTPWN